MVLALQEAGAHGMGDGLLALLRYRETPYPRALTGPAGADAVLEAAARRDVNVLKRLRGLDCGAVLEKLTGLLGPEFAPVLEELPRWQAGADFDFDGLTAFYREHGAGLFARYRAFVWTDGALIPVHEPDCPDEATPSSGTRSSPTPGPCWRAAGSTTCCSTATAVPASRPR